MTIQQRRLLEKFAVGDRPLCRAIAAALYDLDRTRAAAAAGRCVQLSPDADIIRALRGKVRQMTSVLLDAREALADYSRWVEEDGRDPEIEHAAMVRDIDRAMGIEPALPADDGRPF